MSKFTQKDQDFIDYLQSGIDNGYYDEVILKEDMVWYDDGVLADGEFYTYEQIREDGGIKKSRFSWRLMYERIKRFFS